MSDYSSYCGVASGPEVRCSGDWYSVDWDDSGVYSDGVCWAAAGCSGASGHIAVHGESYVLLADEFEAAVSGAADHDAAVWVV